MHVAEHRELSFNAFHSANENSCCELAASPIDHVVERLIGWLMPSAAFRILLDNLGELPYS